MEQIELIKTLMKNTNINFLLGQAPLIIKLMEKRIFH